MTRYLDHIQSHPRLVSILSSTPASFPSIKFDLDNMPQIERKAPQAKAKKPKAAAAETAAVVEDKAQTTVEAVTAKIGELGVAAQAGAGAAASTIGAAVAGLGEKVKEMTVGSNEPVAAAGDKAFNTKKKEKKPKPAAAAAPEPTGPMPSMIDLRVGHILSG